MEMLVGTVLGVAGLLLALYQIRKVERAAIAAKLAAEQSVRQVNTVSLLVLVPELALIDHELHLVAQTEDTREAQRLVREWMATASDLRGLLKAHRPTTVGLSTRVQASLGLATAANTALHQGRSPAQGTTKLREAVTEIVMLARTESSLIRASVEVPQPLPTFTDDLKWLWDRVTKIFKRKEATNV